MEPFSPYRDHPAFRTTSPLEELYMDYSEMRDMANNGEESDIGYVERGDAVDVQQKRDGGDDAGPSLRPRGSGELQTNYSTLNLVDQGSLQRHHKPKKQLVHLLARAWIRFLVTLVLCSIQASIFVYYSRKDSLTAADKTNFNFFKTLAYLCIGLNVAGSFKSASLMLRWKLLARKKHTLDDVDSILGMASLLKVCGFAWRSAKKRRIHVTLVCTAWIVFNAVGRTAIALTGLCYSFEAVQIVTNGEVHLADLTFITGKKDIGLELNTAHTIGGASWIAGTVLGKSIQYTGKPGHFTYTIPQLHKPGDISFIPSPFYVEVVSNCRSWPIIQGGDGTSSTIVYTKVEDGKEKNITMDLVQEVTPGATVYINPRSDHNKEHVCSGVDNPQRCSRIPAIHFVEKDEKKDKPLLFDCQVEVSKMRGKGPDGFKYEMSDESAWVAAGSIGLTGFAKDKDRWDYVRFYKGSPLAPSLPTADQIANITASFAASAIAGLSFFPQSSPGFFKTTSTYKTLGERLHINHYLWPIYGAIVAAQAILALWAALWSNTVFVKDDSYLSTARLLRPIVDRLGPSGCALMGKDIAATLGEFMVYGVRSDSSNMRHHLDIGVDILAQKRFPPGWYDGEVEEKEKKE